VKKASRINIYISLKAGFENICKFFDIIFGIIFFPEGTICFFDRNLVPYKRYPAVRSG